MVTFCFEPLVSKHIRDFRETKLFISRLGCKEGKEQLLQFHSRTALGSLRTSASEISATSEQLGNQETLKHIID